jgi:hypothetical protein
MLSMSCFYNFLYLRKKAKWICLLAVLAACASEDVTVVHKRPIEGMPGYKVLIREAQQPEKIIYDDSTVYKEEQVADIEKKPDNSTSLPEAVSREESLNLTDIAQETASQSLRRQRIPLRRNRYLLLREQLKSADTIIE